MTRAEHGDVEIAGVVGGKQHRPVVGREADLPHLDAENAAALAMIEAAETHDPAAAQQQSQGLHRHQRDGPGEVGARPPDSQRGRPHAL